MSAEDKIPFEEMAVADKARFKEETGAYKEKRAAAGEDSDSDNKKKKKTKKKDKDAPKGAMSAYLYFGSDVRASLKENASEMSATEIMKEIGACIMTVSCDRLFFACI